MSTTSPHLIGPLTIHIPPFRIAIPSIETLIIILEIKFSDRERQRDFDLRQRWLLTNAISGATFERPPFILGRVDFMVFGDEEALWQESFGA